MPNENENIIQLNREDPIAAQLRNAVKQACDPARPLLVQADANGNVKATPPAEVKLTPFPSGALFGYSANPKKPGTQFIHDYAGVNVAIAVSEEVANIICRGCHLFFQLAQKQIEEAKAAEKVAETIAKPVGGGLCFQAAPEETK